MSLDWGLDIYSISVKELTYQRGERALFKPVSFHLNGGECLWVEGSNGVGKSTLLKILAGLKEPHSGHIAWNQAPIAEHKALYRANLYYLGHANGLLRHLTVLENLSLHQVLQCTLPDQTPRRVNFHLAQFQLENVQMKRLAALSAGQQRKVAIVKGILSPKVLYLLDEPFTALDQASIKALTRQIADWSKQGHIVIMSAHQSMPDIDCPMQTLKLESAP